MSDVKRGPKLAADVERLTDKEPKPAPKMTQTKQKPVSKKTVQGHYHNK